ncbi:hypothetical protein D3C86_2009670 [compost metagenome]
MLRAGTKITQLDFQLFVLTLFGVKLGYKARTFDRLDAVREVLRGHWTATANDVNAFLNRVLIALLESVQNLHTDFLVFRCVVIKKS